MLRVAQSMEDYFGSQLKIISSKRTRGREGRRRDGGATVFGAKTSGRGSFQCGVGRGRGAARCGRVLAAGEEEGPGGPRL